jgi:hypothetical protein
MVNWTVEVVSREAPLTRRCFERDSKDIPVNRAERFGMMM